LAPICFGSNLSQGFKLPGSWCCDKRRINTEAQRTQREEELPLRALCLVISQIISLDSYAPNDKVAARKSPADALGSIQSVSVFIEVKFTQSLEEIINENRYELSAPSGAGRTLPASVTSHCAANRAA